ncbi:MAG: hypothetical protein IKF38_06770 [Clostridia bacterium]|nr:hypothetical protein [Clostridia bacterium]
MENIMSKIKDTKILGIVGNALLAVGTLLPMVSVSVFGISQSVSYISGDGIFVLILSIIALLMIFADKLSAKVAFFDKLTNPKLTLIPTALSALLLIIDTANVSSKLGGVNTSLANISFGFGFWVMILGVIAAAAYPFLFKGENK